MKIIKIGAIWCPGCLVMKKVWNNITSDIDLLPEYNASVWSVFRDYAPDFFKGLGLFIFSLIVFTLSVVMILIGLVLIYNVSNFVNKFKWPRIFFIIKFIFNFFTTIFTYLRHFYTL